MSYAGKRGVGERVLEGRHVIGLFLAVILLSGLFFTLGYVMGLHQSEARASADDLPAKPESRSAPKPETVSKRAQKTTPGESSTDTGTPNSSEWEFYHAGEKNKNRSEEHTSELQSHHDLVCRLLLEKKKKNKKQITREQRKKLNQTNNTNKTLKNKQDILQLNRHANEIRHIYSVMIIHMDTAHTTQS